MYFKGKHFMLIFCIWMAFDVVGYFGIGKQFCLNSFYYILENHLLGRYVCFVNFNKFSLKSKQDINLIMETFSKCQFFMCGFFLHKKKFFTMPKLLKTRKVHSYKLQQQVWPQDDGCAWCCSVKFRVCTVLC